MAPKRDAAPAGDPSACHRICRQDRPRRRPATLCTALGRASAALNSQHSLRGHSGQQRSEGATQAGGQWLEAWRSRSRSGLALRQRRR